MLEAAIRVNMQMECFLRAPRLPAPQSRRAVIGDARTDSVGLSPVPWREWNSKASARNQAITMQIDVVASKQM